MADTLSFAGGQTVTPTQQANSDSYQNTGAAPSITSAYTPPNTSAPISGNQIVGFLAVDALSTI